jgi:DNA ligase (NAD+)
VEAKEARIAHLRARRQEAREAYYNLTPIMDDPSYDALGAELESLSPADPDLSVVGAPAPKVSVWEKAEHLIPMGSLSKVNTVEEFGEWVEKTGRALDFVITHKIDGSSMELVYSGGKLVRCVTRGDGLVGEDVTDNVSRIPSVPKEIPISHEDVIVRGEVVMLKSVFEEKYSSDFANPRNTAAGKVRDKRGGGADCGNLSFLAFFLASSTAPGTFMKRFVALEKMGFTVPPHHLGDHAAVLDWHRETSSARDSIPYEIDGTVIYVDDVRIQEELGDHGMRPRGQIAFKFDHAMGATALSDVRWQVGPTGRITPVAAVEPVKIGGVTITSVSLHNVSLFRELALSPGCRVLVSRRNDVIPYIESKLEDSDEEPFQLPAFCPSCAGPTTESGDFLFCKSKSCPSRLSGDVKVWIKKLGLLHWGDAMIEALTDSDSPMISSVADLYLLSPEELSGACSGLKMAKKCHGVLHSNKSIPLELFLGSLNIPILGVGTATDIVQAGFDTVEKVIAMTYDDLVSIPNIGDVTARQVCEGLILKADALRSLAGVLDIRKPAGGALAGMQICITGELSMPRKAIEKMIMEAGGFPKGSVSKTTSLLVTNYPDTTSSKMANAKKHGVKVISEAELMGILRGTDA